MQAGFDQYRQQQADQLIKHNMHMTNLSWKMLRDCPAQSLFKCHPDKHSQMGREYIE